MSDHKIKYDDILKEFDDLVSATTAISYNSGNRVSETSQHYYASVLFSKLTLGSVSLLLSLPRNRRVVSQFEHWDFNSVASHARNLIECYLAFYYICIDITEESEWECRWNIFNLHDCLRRKKMLECLGAESEELKGLSAAEIELCDRLKSNSFFCGLPEKQQKLFLKAKKVYLLSQDELIKKIGLNSKVYRGMYIFLSSQIHSLPLSYYRLDVQSRGQGFENRVERNHIISTLDFVSIFIRKAAIEMIELFPDTGSDSKLTKKSKSAVYKPIDSGWLEKT